MNRCYLGLGSNQKFPERQIRLALKHISSLPRTSITKVSKMYWNKAWGIETQQDFCNAVAEIYTTLPPHLLLKRCQHIEKRSGRVRKMKNGPRTLDIDILIYANLKMKSKNLTIPHPGIMQRDSVLTPLLEINSLVFSINKK